MRIKERARPVTSVLPAGAALIDKREIATVGSVQQFQIHLEDQLAFSAEGLQLDAPGNHQIDRPAIWMRRAMCSPAHACSNPVIAPAEQSQNIGGESRGFDRRLAFQLSPALPGLTHARELDDALILLRFRPAF